MVGMPWGGAITSRPMPIGPSVPGKHAPHGRCRVHPVSGQRTSAYRCIVALSAHHEARAVQPHEQARRVSIIAAEPGALAHRDRPARGCRRPSPVNYGTERFVFTATTHLLLVAHLSSVDKLARPQFTEVRTRSNSRRRPANFVNSRLESTFHQSVDLPTTDIHHPHRYADGRWQGEPDEGRRIEGVG
jgi:hypothetical protein